jgi:hypothetical protein
VTTEPVGRQVAPNRVMRSVHWPDYHHRVRLLPIAVLLVFTLTSCFESHRLGARPGEGSDAGEAPSPRDLGSAEPERFDPDTAPECPFEDVEPDPSAPYPFCQWEGSGGYRRYCPRDERGHGYQIWHANKGDSEYCDEDTECNACVCYDSCRSDADCPRPESGDATAECLILSTGPTQCFLTCDDFERCPTGMECVDNLEFGHFVCVWITRGDRCG